MKPICLLICTLYVHLVHADSSLRLHHRIWNPFSPPPPFSLRADLHLSRESGPALIVLDNAVQLQLDPDHLEESLYQVALEREGDLSESDWDLSSVKACHLPGLESDIIKLHLSATDRAYAVDYFVRPVPHDGSCPKKGPVSRTGLSFTNTTITLLTASSPPLPELRVPPPLSPKGEPIQPEPETSFLQKYWMYIALGLVALTLTGGAPAEEEQTGQTQGRATGGRVAGR